ncbi:hypothetical protein [Companilactobacillus bobalius]|uniref:Uncharacterized protein n=2 Tax=Companilactobacillus bobalius TaxID=2801451 RepID=A0A202F7U2_9LACO|nr:hypothetical protein [Companilactobacillus bobalius]GEO58466.1 hypothetical protein LBO01_15950 [Companilactobacillus paralimentarius]KAE9557584.1 hypothetical protein ATN92_15645 [Companilactobacillus bobalius]KAE9563730.1 hypothetical protein ATN92_03095 [Companilactobacillus bobalius]KRK83476.1 hypothetical protein FC78_GL001432 [Companilactobacillus bobalius DSM 19674]OVE96559.1 hypothetical protein LKACC16343_02228 [Companilactobacillus bobalius]
MKLETYKALPINRSPIRLLKRDYLARMDFDLVGFPSGTVIKFKALLPDGQEYEDNDSSHFRILGSQLTYRIPRSLSESSGSLVSAFFVINNIESSRLLIHITEPNDIKSNNYIGQMDRIMNHVLSDAILINEISTNGSGIIDAKTDELIKQITDWTNTTLAKVKTTVSSSLASIADVRAVIDKEIDVDRNNFTSKMTDVQSNINKANETMQSLTKTLDATKAEVNKIDVVQMQNDAKSAKDAANAIQSKMGNVPTGSTVMSEISKAQLVTGATVNGKDVAISNKRLQITLPNPDLSSYVKTSTLNSYAKTTDVDTKLKDYAKKGEIVTEGTIVTKTPLYRSTNLWVQSKNNWQNPKDMSGGSSFQLDTDFKPSDLKNGIFIGIDKHLITDNTTYPVAYMPSLSGLIIPKDIAKFSETNFYYFISKEEIQAALIAGNYILVNEPLDGSVLRDRDGNLAGVSSWNGDRGQIKLVFGDSNDGKIENLFIQVWLPSIKYSSLTINVMSFPVIDEVIAV